MILHIHGSGGTISGRAAVLFAVLLVIASHTGCRTLQPLREGAAIPNQFQLAVDSFQIYSSFPLADDDPLARELAELRVDVQTMLHLARSARPTEIYIFDDRSRFDQFMQANYPDLPRRRAFFIAQGQREVVYAFRDDRLVEDLRHEACHALLHSCVGSMPLWLDEGLAEYFETPGDGDGLHTRHAAELQAALRQGWRPSLTRLEGLTQLPQLTARDYGEAWAWVYWLLQVSPHGRLILLNYLQDIHSGAAREPLSARLFAVSARPDVALVSMIGRF
jgi:hypothetical protein